MMQLIRWDCGCIGLPTQHPKEAFVIEHCDGGHCNCDPPLSPSRRDMSKKEFTEASPEDQVRILEELAQLVADGYKLRGIRSLLEKPVRR
jgi:hypothetical protein